MLWGTSCMSWLQRYACKDPGEAPEGLNGVGDADRGRGAGNVNIKPLPSVKQHGADCCEPCGAVCRGGVRWLLVLIAVRY